MKTIQNIMIDNLFKMVVEEEKIYIKQFKKMILLEEKHIRFITHNKSINIYGNSLKIKKLVNHEILLTGQINKIEVEDAK